MASYRFVIVDVFTDRPLAGNQLAVFTDATRIPEDLLQPLANEMGFSETAFVYPPTARGTTQGPPPMRTAERRDERATDATVGVEAPAQGGHARIRIFTPMSEMEFAGHPVLGTAFVLGTPLQLVEIRLETRVGIVPVTLERDGPRIVFGRMSQPVPRVEPFPQEAELLRALGVERSELPVELYDLGIRHVYVALPTPDDVARLAPDVAALARLTGYVGANCFAGEGRRWKTRMFAPGDGVPEDPATGSAAGPLACHLARHGRVPWGQEIEISQGVEMGRPSTLYARADGSADAIERVEVGGAAVVVARGELRLPA